MARTECKPLPEFTASDIERFWSRVAKRGREDCWIWQGTTNRSGYGLMAVGSRKPYRIIRAHRIAYLLDHGKDPGSLLVCHTCDNPPCVNPFHLWLGDIGANIRDAATKGRIQSGDDHHSRRHPENSARGERQGRSKLKEGDIVAIRSLHETGHWSYPELAAKFGVDKAHICLIVHRKTWRHVA